MTKNKTEKLAPFKFKRDVLYPAAAVFTAILLGMFSLNWLLGANVTEVRDRYTVKYNKDGSILNDDWLIGESKAFGIGMLVGIFLFSMSIFVLIYFLRQDFGRATKRVIHFVGTELSFAIFVLLFSDYVSGETFTFGLAMVAMVVVAILYFLTLAIKFVLSVPIRLVKNNFGKFIYSYIGPIFVIFTLTVFVTAFVSLFGVTNVEIRLPDQWNPNLIESYETLVTPIAHTLQNFLRYLGSAVMLVLSVSVFKMPISKVAKGLLNLLICSAAFFGIWYVQMPYFYERAETRIASIIIFYSVYLAVFIIACVVAFVIKRQKEKKEGYVSQFSGRRGKKKSEGSTLFTDK
jgi:hypothetical protein